MSVVEDRASEQSRICTQIGVVYHAYLLPAISILCATSILMAICVYLKAYIKAKLKIKKGLFYVGLIYFILSMSIYIMQTLILFRVCYTLKHIEVYIHIFMELYAFQTLSLQGQLYYRLYGIFQKVSSLSLAKCTNITFWTYYIFTTVIFLCGVLIYIYYKGVGSNLTALIGLLVIGLTIYLDVLFLYKLNQVYKASQKHREKLMHLITKTSLLAFISTFITILTVIVSILTDKYGGAHWSLVRNLFVLTDIYTNFGCIFLSYSYFDGFYTKICGCCDVLCRRIWSSCFENNDIPNMELEVQLSNKSKATKNVAEGP